MCFYDEPLCLTRSIPTRGSELGRKEADCTSETAERKRGNPKHSSPSAVGCSYKVSGRIGNDGVAYSGSFMTTEIFR